MATPSSGDKFIPVKTIDGKLSAFKLPTASAAGDLFVPVKTADGKLAAMKVVPITAADEQGFPVKTADGKITIVKGAVGRLAYLEYIRIRNSGYAIGSHTYTMNGASESNVFNLTSYIPVGSGAFRWAETKG